MAKPTDKPSGSARITGSRARAADETVKRLRAYHALGREALARDPEGAAPDPATARELAAKKKYGLGTVQEARRFARTYPAGDLEELLRLRSPAGTPLSWGHVRQLISIPGKRARETMAKQAAREGWTARRLVSAIQGEVVGRKRRSGGGRRFAAPRSPEEGLRQVAAHTGEWLRRCRGAWSEGAAWLSDEAWGTPGATNPEAKARLEAAREGLRKMARAALELEACLEAVAAGLKDEDVGGEAVPASSEPAKPGSRKPRRPGVD